MLLPKITTDKPGFALLFCPYCECSGPVHLMVSIHLPACAPKTSIPHAFR